MAYFKKPKGVRYVDMAIYIDNHAYNKTITPEESDKIFEYLYLLSKMLAWKGKYFQNSEDYDNFGIFMASKMYLRLFNQKQYQIDSEGNRKMEPLKSCLNYLKSILPMARIDYQQENYAQTKSKNEYEIAQEFNLSHKLKDSLADLSFVDFDWCLDNTKGTFREILNHSIIKGNKSEYHSLYISCMLSFINMCVLKKETLNKILNLKYNDHLKMRELEKAFLRQNDPSYVILYHLDESMRNLVFVLVNEAKQLMANELGSSLHTLVNVQCNLDLLALSQINVNAEQFEEED